MKAKDLILVALICANVSLASAALVLYVADAEPAAQATMSNRAGDYIMVTGPVSESREALLIVDIVAKRANLYVPKPGVTVKGVEFELKSTRNLAADFGARPR